jgi:hypothetical protein
MALLGVHSVQLPEWRQKYDGLSSDLKAVIQPLAQAYKEDYLLASDEEGMRMATEIYTDDPKCFFEHAARHARSMFSTEYMLDVYCSLDAAQQMAIEFVVENKMLTIRDEVNIFLGAAAERAHRCKWTYEYCTNCEAFLSEFYDLAPRFVVRASYLTQIYNQIPGDKARFLAEHSDKSKADITELYLEDRAKFELQYDVVYAYAQSMARARQVSKHWRSVCNENTEEPYMCIVKL